MINIKIKSCIRLKQHKLVNFDALQFLTDHTNQVWNQYSMYCLGNAYHFVFIDEESKFWENIITFLDDSKYNAELFVEILHYIDNNDTDKLKKLLMLK